MQSTVKLAGVPLKRLNVFKSLENFRPKSARRQLSTDTSTKYTQCKEFKNYCKCEGVPFRQLNVFKSFANFSFKRFFKRSVIFSFKSTHPQGGCSGAVPTTMTSDVDVDNGGLEDCD